MTGYKIESVQDQLMLSKTGQWINGKRVYFTLDAYGETMFVDVPSMTESVVRSAVETEVKKRDILAGLTPKTS